MLGYAEVYVNNARTVSYRVDFDTEDELKTIIAEASDKGYGWPSITRYKPLVKPEPIIFDFEDEDIII